MKSHYRTMTYAKAAAIRVMYWVGDMTQAEIAKAVGMRQGTVSRIIGELVWIPPESESWLYRMPASCDMREVRSGRRERGE